MITGGTGSLGSALVKHLLSGRDGTPESITIMSRDEAKQHAMRLAYLGKTVATDEVIYENFKRCLRFLVGDVRDYGAVCQAAQGVDVIIHAAAMKQVPTCQYQPWEACRTNIGGLENIIEAITILKLPVQTVIGISTDKAVAACNAYGKSKGLQEDLMVAANLHSQVRFVNVRYGNVVGSRGSVIPLFREQIASGGPVTVTTKEMTRFWLTLDNCVQTVMDAAREAKPGETYVPILKSSRIYDLARLMIGDRAIEIVETGIRPGEKVHEILVSPEERARTIRRGSYYVVLPMLPELVSGGYNATIEERYCSADCIMTIGELARFLTEVKE